MQKNEICENWRDILCRKGTGRKVIDGIIDDIERVCGSDAYLKGNLMSGIVDDQAVMPLALLTLASLPNLVALSIAHYPKCQEKYGCFYEDLYRLSKVANGEAVGKPEAGCLHHLEYLDVSGRSWLHGSYFIMLTMNRPPSLPRARFNRISRQLHASAFSKTFFFPSKQIILPQPEDGTGACSPTLELAACTFYCNM